MLPSCADSHHSSVIMYEHEYLCIKLNFSLTLKSSVFLRIEKSRWHLTCLCEMTHQSPLFEKLKWYLSDPSVQKCVGGMRFLMLTSKRLLTQPSEGEYEMLLLQARLYRSMSSKAHFSLLYPLLAAPATPVHCSTKTARFQPPRYGLVVRLQPTDY